MRRETILPATQTLLIWPLSKVLGWWLYIVILASLLLTGIVVRRVLRILSTIVIIVMVLLYNWIIALLKWRPIYAIALRFTAATENWEWPEPLISAKNLSNICHISHVIGTFVGLPFLIEVLDSRLIGLCKVYVELQEEGKKHCNDTC